jgi:hypothetical protein
MSDESRQNTVIRLSTCLHHQMTQCSHAELLPLYDSIKKKLLDVDNTAPWDTKQRDFVSQTLAKYQQFGYEQTTPDKTQIEIDSKTYDTDSSKMYMAPANKTKGLWHNVVYDETFNMYEPKSIHYKWPNKEIRETTNKKMFAVLKELLKDREFWKKQEEKRCEELLATPGGSQVADAAKTITNLEAQLSKADERLETLKINTDNGADENNRLREQIRDLNAKNTEEIAEKDKKIAGGTKQLDESKKLNVKLTTALRECNEKLIKMEAMNEKLTIDLATQKQLTDELEADKKQLTDELEAAQTKLTDVQEADKGKIIDEMQAAQKKLTDKLETEKNQIIGELEAAQNKITGQTVRIEELEGQMEGRSGELTEVTELLKNEKMINEIWIGRNGALSEILKNYKQESDKVMQTYVSTTRNTLAELDALSWHNPPSGGTSSSDSNAEDANGLHVNIQEKFNATSRLLERVDEYILSVDKREEAITTLHSIVNDILSDAFNVKWTSVSSDRIDTIRGFVDIMGRDPTRYKTPLDFTDGEFTLTDVFLLSSFRYMKDVNTFSKSMTANYVVQDPEIVEALRLNLIEDRGEGV